MQNLDAPLADDGTERAGVFLTNALTGWEPRVTKPLPFPDLEEARDRAEQVKQETQILVILGNPPYNGFAGVAVDEERELSGSLSHTRTGAASRRPGAERSLRSFLPHGGAAHRGEDRPGSGLLHLQLFVARRVVLHRDAGTLPRSVPDSTA